MKLCLWIAALLLVVVGTNADGELDLMDAFGLDPEPETEKPKKPISGGGGEFDLMDAFGLDPTNPPKVPEKAKPKSNDGELDLMDAFGLDPEPETEKPKKPISGGGDGGFDLGDALGPDPEPEKPKKPTSGGGGDGGFDLGDALGPDPDPKPAVPPKTGGGGGGGGGGVGFDDSDLWDDSKGELKPEGGAGGLDPNNDGGADQPQAGAGQIAGIASAVGMAILGAASSYVAYQKKKLCFKIQGGTDPESGKNYEGNRGQPRQNAGGNPLSVLTNLLRTS